jgi:hypothetical protein
MFIPNMSNIIIYRYSYLIIIPKYCVSTTKVPTSFLLPIVRALFIVSKRGFLICLTKKGLTF